MLAGAGRIVMVDVSTAEEERLQQAPLIADDGADFAQALNEPAAHVTFKPGGGASAAAAAGPPPVAAIAAAGHKGPASSNAHAAPPPARTHSNQPPGHASTRGAPHAHSHAAAAPPPAHPGSSTAASPTASASPHAGTHSYPIPYVHAPALFAANAVYLHPLASPSQRDGLTAADEFLLRAHTCMFMSSLGQRLKLGQLALATASVFAQVFFTHYSFKAFDRLEIACTCLFLAGKVEERRARVDHVLNAYYVDREQVEKKLSAAAQEDFAPRPRAILDSPEWDSLRNRVYEYEALLLDAIEYNFDVLHPYSYLRKFLEKYIYSSVYRKESAEFLSRHLGGPGGLAQIAWNFINDSLRTSLCLQYAPSIICVAAIRMAMRHLITVTKNLAEEPTRTLMPGQAPPAKVKPWFEELFGVSKRTMTTITSEIMNVLEMQKDPQLDVRVLEAHRKCKQRSTVPLPCARSTQELMASARLAQKQQQQQQQQQQGQRGAQQPAHAAPTHTTHGGAPSGGGHGGDRKRARSPGVKHEGGARPRDVVDLSRSSRPARSPRHAYPAYEPLDRPPSPFLDADVKRSWLPDLRRDKRDEQHRSHQHQQKPRDGREREKDRGRPHEREQHRPHGSGSGQGSRSNDRSDASAAGVKSPHVRPHSREHRGSHRRSNSRDAANRMSDVGEAAGSAAASAELEDGEITVESISEAQQQSAQQLSTIREEGSSEPPSVAARAGELLLSPHALLASSSALTKSCSSLTLSSMSLSHAAARLHSSVSMSDLSSAGAGASVSVDILAGDILRMSSSHSPSDPALAMSLGGGAASGVVNEEDIMREIRRGKDELQCDDDEEDESNADGPSAKRARVASSHTASPFVAVSTRSVPGEFEAGSHSTHSHAGMESSVVGAHADASPSQTQPASGAPASASLAAAAAVPPVLDDPSDTSMVDSAQGDGEVQSAPEGAVRTRADTREEGKPHAATATDPTAEPTHTDEMGATMEGQKSHSPLSNGHTAPEIPPEHPMETAAH